MYDFEKEFVINLYNQGYSKYAIAKKTRKTWQSVDIVIDRYLDEIKRDQDIPEKPKTPIGGKPAIFVVLFLVILGVGFWIYSLLKEKGFSLGGIQGEEREPEARKENLFDPSRDIDQL